LFVRLKGGNKQEKEEEMSLIEKDNDNFCIICTLNTNEIILRPCGHTGFCKECTLEYLKIKKFCPLCRTAIKKAYILNTKKEIKSVV